MRKEKFNQRDLERAVGDFAMLRFWTAEMRAPVMELLQRMCPHKEALTWLVDTVVNRLGEWPGSAELRGLLCTRYDAADGIDQWCSLPGFTAAEAEAKCLDKHLAVKGGSCIGTPEILAEIRSLGVVKQLPSARKAGS